MKLILWGAGMYGNRIFDRLGADNIVAYIDSNHMKIGTTLHGKKIISLEEYMENYRGTYIVITMLIENDIGQRLREKNIFSYFDILDCPGEYYSPENYLGLVRSKIAEGIDSSKECYIYGDNFFAVDIASYLSMGNSKVVIILPPDEEVPNVQALKIGFPELTFVQIESISDLHNYHDKIYVANGWDYEELSKELGAGKLVNIFETHDYLSEYYNRDLERLKGSHKGESCFIIGNGPSLRADDLSLLKDNGIVSFGVNNINKIFTKTHWRPTYFVMSDFVCFTSPDFDAPENYSEVCSFVSDNSIEYWEKNESAKNMRFHGIYRSSSKMRSGFSDDIVKGIFLSGTVIYGCIQIAVYMGFKKIYLLGNDLIDPNSEDKSVGHFFAEEKKLSLRYVSKFIKEFSVAREYVEQHNVNIYNATRGGFLEVFKRVDFDSLFENGKFKG